MSGFWPRFWTDPFPGCRVRYPGFVLLQGPAQGVDRFADSIDPSFVGFRVIDGLLGEGLSPFQGLDHTDQLWHWAQATVISCFSDRAGEGKRAGRLS